MCNCKNVDFGTFGQPNQNRTAVMTCTGKMQEIDNCILDELKYLWKYHVITFASCCGHNKINGSIIVDEGSVGIMKQLGYVRAENPTWFYSKSTPITNKHERKISRICT